MADYTNEGATTLATIIPPRLMTLELPEFLEAAGELAAHALSSSLQEGADELQEQQAKLEGLAHTLRRLKDSEGAARRAELLACVCARAIGTELGPGKRGRPAAGEELPLPELDAGERKRYRLSAELSPVEFLTWAKKATTVSVDALAKEGAKARKSSSPAPKTPSPGSSPKPEGPVDPETGEELDEEGPGEEEAPKPSPEEAKTERLWQAKAARLAQDIEEQADEIEAEFGESPHERVKAQAAECCRSARETALVLRSIAPPEEAAS